MTHLKKTQVLVQTSSLISLIVIALGLAPLKISRPVIQRLLFVIVAVGVLPLIYQQWKFVQQFSNANKAINTEPPLDGVTLSRRLIGRMRGGRLGNEMFVYASLIGIAHRNKMIPVYKGRQLRIWFRITAEESSLSEVDVESGAVTEISANKVDSRFDKLASIYTGDVTIVGFFQCWRYFDEVRSLVRQEFQFRREIREATWKFLQNNTRSANTYREIMSRDINVIMTFVSLIKL